MAGVIKSSILEPWHHKVMNCSIHMPVIFLPTAALPLSTGQWNW